MEARVLQRRPSALNGRPPGYQAPFEVRWKSDQSLVDGVTYGDGSAHEGQECVSSIRTTAAPECASIWRSRSRCLGAFGPATSFIAEGTELRENDRVFAQHTERDDRNEPRTGTHMHSQACADGVPMHARDRLAETLMNRLRVFFGVHNTCLLSL